MTTINDLPVELLSHIFRLVDRADRSTTLPRASLVCRRWRFPAQEEMWRVVSFSSRTPFDPSVQKYLDSQGSRRFKSRVVCASGPGYTHELVRLVENCDGLRELCLRDMWRQRGFVSRDLLPCLALASLTHLTLGSNIGFDHSSPPPPPSSFPFHLTSLRITLDRQQIPLHLLKSLLQPTVTSFSLHVIDAPHSPPVPTTTLLSTIESRAHNFTRVHFHDLGTLYFHVNHEQKQRSDESTSDRMGQFWSAFTSVEILTCSFGDLKYLEDPSTNLSMLDVDLRWSGIYSASPFAGRPDRCLMAWSIHLVEFLRKSATLKRVKLVNNARSLECFNIDWGYKDIVEICRGKEIVLVWSGAWGISNEDHVEEMEVET